MQPPIFGASTPLDIAPGVTLVIKADLQGHITYANAAYLATSGYALHELVGSPHSIVHQQDTPAAVLDGMWQALRSGTPWQGTVKNHCKNGRVFWTHTSIVPIQRDAHITGYMAVLQRAEPGAIEAAQHSQGETASSNATAPNQRFSNWGVRAGMRAGFGLVTALVLAGGLLGIVGLKLSDAAFSRLYQDQFVPAAAISQVEARLGDIRSGMLEMQLDNPAGTPVGNASQRIENLQNAFDEIHEVLSPVTVSAQANTSATAALAKALHQYAGEGRGILNQAASNNPERLSTSVQEQLRELQNKASLSAHALRQALMDSAQQGLAETLQRNSRIRTLAIVGIVLGLLLIGVVGRQFVHSIVSPLNSAIQRLHRIAEGDLQSEVKLSGSGETAQLNQAAMVMQLHLKVMLDEIALAARRIQQHCQAMNQSLHEVTEHSEAQHDQVHSAIRALNQAVTETSDLSQRAERLMHMASSADTASDDAATLEQETRELATATRLTAFGAEEVAGAMRDVATLIVQNRSEAQLAWQASEALMRTAGELNQLVDFFAPQTPIAAAPTESVQSPETIETKAAA